MSQYTIVHPTNPQTRIGNGGKVYNNLCQSVSGNIFVDVDEDIDQEDLDRLLDLSRYGVVVRESTREEIDYVWGMDVELDYSEPDTCRHWPDEEGEIILQIKDW